MTTRNEYRFVWVTDEDTGETTRRVLYTIEEFHRLWDAYDLMWKYHVRSSDDDPVGQYIFEIERSRV